MSFSFFFKQCGPFALVSKEESLGGICNQRFLLLGIDSYRSGTPKHWIQLKPLPCSCLVDISTKPWQKCTCRCYNLGDRVLYSSFFLWYGQKWILRMENSNSVIGFLHTWHWKHCGCQKKKKNIPCGEDVFHNQFQYCSQHKSRSGSQGRHRLGILRGISFFSLMSSRIMFQTRVRARNQSQEDRDVATVIGIHVSSSKQRRRSHRIWRRKEMKGRS